MENKKQLIMIPPMSEALKKLSEVLESISDDENVEVTMIDDLKELSQFVASTGQCLIVASNAKKCATFLQENKVMLAKSNCKVILFTPMEIPTKILTKFTKIGLTESILESSLPKTILYKVKLLLRSIKTARPQEDSDKLIKTFENENASVTGNTDLELIEKFIFEDQNIQTETDTKNKTNDHEELLAQKTPMKSRSHSEEQIDTNWKSDRKKDINLNFTEEKTDTPESEFSNIDMFYHGKKKKLDSMLEFDENDLGKPKNIELIDLQIANATKVLPVDSNGPSEDDTTKNINQLKDILQSEEEQKKRSIEITLSARDKKNKKSLDDITPEIDIEPYKSHQKYLDEEGTPKTRNKDVEDLGGHLKGKISKDIMIESVAEDDKLEQYDNSEIEKEFRPKKIEIDLLTEDNENSKQNKSTEQLNNIHDGIVDKIDTNMIGNSASVEKIRSQMNGKKHRTEDNLLEQEDHDLINDEKKRTHEQELENKNEKDLNEINSLDLNNHLKELEVENLDNDKNNELKKSHISLDLLTAATKSSLESLNKSEEKMQKKHASSENDLSSDFEKSSYNETDQKNSDLTGHSTNPSEIKQEKAADHIHDGKVDKIDKFFRSGPSKKQEQDWDILSDKKSKIDLVNIQKKSGMNLQAAEKKDFEETTIDYRKLKQEFELMASDNNRADHEVVSDLLETKINNDEDKGSFKVIEINSSCLDFSINVINSIFNKDIKIKQIFAMISEELIDKYKCFPLFYNYSSKENKFSEVFNSLTDIQNIKISSKTNEWWIEFKNNTELFEHFQSKSMTTWRCPEIINNNKIWEDVELPSWANQELQNKHLELIFPYYDGLDRMGLAIVIFPEGINPKAVNDFLTILEMARTLFLETIERYKMQQQIQDALPREEVEKKGVLGFFSGIFSKKKAG